MPTDAGLSQPPGDVPRKPSTKPKRKPRPKRERSPQAVIDARRDAAAAIARAERKAIREAGRPSTYRPDFHPAQARNYALLGLNDVEIAEAFGIPQSTLNEWKLKHPAFPESLNSGKLQADGSVASAVYQRAVGMSHQATKVFLTKDGEVIEHQYQEHLAPDVRAAQMWLYNRQPGRWRERRQVEVTGGLELQIAQMPQELRLERLRELQAKAGLLLEGTVTDAISEDVEDGE